MAVGAYRGALSKSVRNVLLGLMLLAVLATAFLTYRYLDSRGRIEADAFASAQRQAESAAADISADFARVMDAAQRLADDLSRGALPYPDIIARMRTDTVRDPQIEGLAVTFEPFVYDPTLELYQAYLYKTDDGYDLLEGATYNYTVKSDGSDGQPNTLWYHTPLESGAQWTEPFFATGAQKVLIEYGLPFYRTDDPQTPAGVVTVDYTNIGIRALLAELDLGATGYAAVISPLGGFIVHPTRGVAGQQGVFDYIDTQRNDLLRDVQTALKGQPLSATAIDPLTDENAWFFFQPIAQTGWTLLVVLNQSEFLPPPQDTVREQMTIALVGAAALVLLMALVLRVYRGTIRSQWTLAIVFSLVSLALVILAPSLAAQVHPSIGVTVSSPTALDSYLTNALHELCGGLAAIVVRDAKGVRRYAAGVAL